MWLAGCSVALLLVAPPACSQLTPLEEQRRSLSCANLSAKCAMILWHLCEQPSGNSCSCNEVAAKSFVNSEHLVALHSQAGFKS